MRTSFTACLAAATLVLAACGSSDGGSSDDNASGASDRDTIAELLMTAADDEGFELDRGCVDDNVAQLSDDDAKALADSGLDGGADISEAGAAVGENIFSECVDASSYLDVLVASFGADEPTLDTDCLTSALEGKTVDEIDEELFEAAVGCTSES